NDLYGLSYGDTILESTATILKKIIDKNDTIYRFGGDEFAILILNKDSVYLEKEAKRIVQEYNEIKHEYYNNTPANKITFSMGSSHYPSISKNKEDLISQANMALYQAKNMGDDKVHFYQDIMLQIHKDIKSDQQLIGVFKGLLSTIVTKDKYTFGHCERVSSYAVMISDAMGLNLKEIKTIKQAGLLHDIGKIELPKSVLNKIGRLTDEEFELIRQHPVYSANILEPLSGMDNLIDYVKHHHERYDGKGYPDGLEGENISLGARILCVADSFDAMVSDRPYRKSMSIEEAFREIEKCSGSQFDPEVAKYFINAMRNKMSIKYNYTLESNEPFQKGYNLHVR
ncbi:MAG TPA: diguanylate cyclase, partial [Clostridia bacterium]